MSVSEFLMLWQLTIFCYCFLFQECCISLGGMWYLKGTVHSWQNAWESRVSYRSQLLPQSLVREKLYTGRQRKHTNQSLPSAEEDQGRGRQSITLEHLHTLMHSLMNPEESETISGPSSQITLPCQEKGWICWILCTFNFKERRCLDFQMLLVVVFYEVI